MLPVPAVTLDGNVSWCWVGAGYTVLARVQPSCDLLVNKQILAICATPGAKYWNYVDKSSMYLHSIGISVSSFFCGTNPLINSTFYIKKKRNFSVVYQTFYVINYWNTINLCFPELNKDCVEEIGIQ